MKVLYDTNKEKLDTPHIKGYDFNNGVDYEKLLSDFKTFGL